MQKVLIVDDDPGTLETFQLILRLASIEVAIAQSGYDGLRLARQNSYDLVLADLRLPDITGLDILQALHTEGHKVPTVIMTAFGSINSAVQAMRLGAWDYV